MVHYLFLTCVPHPNLRAIPTRRSSDLGHSSTDRAPSLVRMAWSEWPGQDGQSRSSSERNASGGAPAPSHPTPDRKSTRLNSSHLVISYAVFCLKKIKYYIN